MRAIRAPFVANGISLGVFYPFTAVIPAVRGVSAVLAVAAAIVALAVFPYAGLPRVLEDDRVVSLPFTAPTLG